LIRKHCDVQNPFAIKVVQRQILIRLKFTEGVGLVHFRVCTGGRDIDRAGVGRVKYQDLQAKAKEIANVVLWKGIHNVRDDECMSFLGDTASTLWSGNMRAMKGTTTCTIDCCGSASMTFQIGGIHF